MTKRAAYPALALRRAETKTLGPEGARVFEAGWRGDGGLGGGAIRHDTSMPEARQRSDRLQIVSRLPDQPAARFSDRGIVGNCLGHRVRKRFEAGGKFLTPGRALQHQHAHGPAKSIPRNATYVILHTGLHIGDTAVC